MATWRIRLLTVSSLALSIAACGGEDNGGVANPAAAGYAVTQLGTIGASVEAGSPDAAASGVITLGTVAQTVIVPKSQGGATARQALARPALPLTGTCACTATGCTFDGCSDDAGSFTIDGSIEVDGDTYRFDVSIDQSYDSADTSSSTTLATSGEITITPTYVDGELSGGGDTTITTTDPDGEQTISGSWDWDLSADAIVLDDSRCAVDGSLDASLSVSAESSYGTSRFHGWGTVLFGPSCGDATAQ